MNPRHRTRPSRSASLRPLVFVAAALVGCASRVENLSDPRPMLTVPSPDASPPDAPHPTDAPVQPADTGVQLADSEVHNADTAPAPDAADERDAHADSQPAAPDVPAVDVVVDAAIPVEALVIDSPPGPINTTASVCDGAVSVRNPADTRERTLARPWDGASVATPADVARIDELRLDPPEGLSYLGDMRLQLHAYARVGERWYDATALASWAVTPAYATELGVTVAGSGLVTLRGDRFSLTDLDVHATLSGRRTTTDWFWGCPALPNRVLGPTTVQRCVPERVGLELDFAGSLRQARPEEFPRFVRFVVNDPTVLAVGDDGTLVGLRAGAATVSALFIGDLCNAGTCTHPEARETLTVTVTE